MPRKAPLSESQMESRVDRSMAMGAEGSLRRGPRSMSLSLSGPGSSSLLASRLNTSHSPTAVSGAGAGVFPPEAKSSPSEPLRISKLISIWLSVSSSSGMVLIISGPSSSQRPDATFLTLRLLPLRPGALPDVATELVFTLGPFLARPRPREAVPCLLDPSASCASTETGSSKSLSSLKFTLRRVWTLRCTLGALGTSGLVFVRKTSSNTVKGTPGPACLTRPGGLGVQGGPPPSRPFREVCERGRVAEPTCWHPRLDCPDCFWFRGLEGSEPVGLFIDGGCQPQELAKSWAVQQLRLVSFARAWTKSRLARQGSRWGIRATTNVNPDSKTFPRLLFDGWLSPSRASCVYA